MRHGSLAPQPNLTLVFTKPGDFAALYAAEAFLESRGFSVGSLQAHSPSGILFGDFAIAKWRNMNDAERHALHGTMTADSFRDGPVTISIRPNAPAAAIAAFQAMLPSDVTEAAHAA